MKTEKKIIKLFIEENQPKTIREISKKIKSDYRITHTATQRLLEKNILLSQIVGKSILCELNESYYGAEIYEAENKRKEYLLKNKDLKQLYREVLAKLKSAFFIFLVFGSHAKGKPTKSSDIDIIFISNENDFEEKIQNIVSLLPIKTHVLVFTEEEFMRMKDSKKSNVIKEVIKNNIILYGIENYYRLKNA
ncbi:MAG TPA: nucleotidyltransferase domain-containing protein [Candidatus Paceibacterota bacterium]|nr:nucleotidyltransferase domain-containing protein [Candidatus Paceibacterota bacterium]